MKNILLFKAQNQKKKSIGLHLNLVLSISFLLIFLLQFISLHAQRAVESLSYATDGDVLVTKIKGDALYLGGKFSHVGLRTGFITHFHKDSILPDKEWPLFGSVGDTWTRDRVNTVVSDDEGGWYIGGTFGRVQNEEYHGLVHILADKSIDPAFFVTWHSFNKINALKKDGDYLYVVGNFSIRDAQDSLHLNLMRINLKTNEVDPQWNPLVAYPLQPTYTKSKAAGEINFLEISNDYVFVGGWPYYVQGTYQDALAVLDKHTGKLVPFPTCSDMSAMNLMGDTLFVGQNDLYWSNKKNGFGYIARGLAVLDEQNDSISDYQKTNTYLYGSVPDGKGGWFVCGRVDGADGIFHVNAALKKFAGFSQNSSGLRFRPTLPWQLHGQSLYFCNQTDYDPQIDIGNGRKESYLFKMDTASGAFDPNFYPRARGRIYAMAFKGDTLFVGGTFDSIGGMARNGLAAVNALTGKVLPWNPVIHKDNFDAGFTGGNRVIRALNIAEGKLYVAGRFQIPTNTLDSNGRGIYGIARYVINTGHLDSTFHAWTRYFDNPLFTSLIYDYGKLFVLGNFKLPTTEGNIIDAAWINLAQSTIHNINKDIVFTSEKYVYNYYQGMSMHNGKLYMWNISAKNAVTGEHRNHIIVLDPETMTIDSWNPMANDKIYTVTWSQDKILVGGTFYFLHYESGAFAGINIKNRQYVHMPDISTINAITHSDKYIFVGGDFNRYKDSIVNSLFRLNRKDLSFSPFHHHIKNATSRPQIGMLAMGINGLYVTGLGRNTFNNVGGVERPNICLLDPETADLKSWNPPPSDGVIIRVFPYRDDVFLSGAFNLMPAWKRSGIARIDLKTGKPDTWSPSIQGWYPYVNDMLFTGDTLFIAGTNISKINTVETGNLAAISVNSGTPFSGFKAPDFSLGVRLLYKDGASLFAVSSNYDIRKVDAVTGSGTQWTSVVTGGKILSLVSDTNDLYIAGGLQIEDNWHQYPLLRVNKQNGTLIKAFDHYPVNSFVLGKNDRGEIVTGVQHPAYVDSVSLYRLDRKNDTLYPLNAHQNFQRGVSKIQSIGNYFLAFGQNMAEKGKFTTKPGLFVYSPEDDTVITAFSTPVINGSASTFAANEKILAFGGVFGGMNSILKSTDIALMQTPKLLLKPGVTSWFPHKANTTNPFGLAIYGSGFDTHTEVVLYVGKAIVSPDSITISSRKMTAYFNGTHFTPGNWDLNVKLSATDSLVFSAAVKLEEGVFTDTWMHWIGPAMVRSWQPATFYVTYGNRSNQDAYGVFLYIAVGPQVTVRIHRKLEYPEVKFDVDWDTIPHFVDVDYFLGEPFHGRVYTLFFPYLPPHFEDALQLTVTSFQSHDVRFAISKPIFKDYAQLAENMKSTENAAYNFFNCMYAVADAVADLTPGLGCAKAAFDNIVMAGIDHYVKHQSVQTEDVANAVGMIALGCVPGGSQMRTAFAVAKGMAGAYGAAGGIVGACGPFVEDMSKGLADLMATSSHDPNAKYGPAGKNASIYVPSKQPYNYMVTFENDSTATAPAQRVIITDTLDLSVFDINTFKAVGFGFADTSYIYKNSDGDTVDIDLRPDKSYIVRVFHHLNTSTGVLTWHFLTLDPNTYEPVSGVSDGFLPPNRTAPEGEGNILYAITPKADLAEGTGIKNKAHIVFDWNEEIPTDIWRNVTDNTPPESKVAALPEITMTQDFTVSWYGSDAGDGIYSYTVFVSENDSDYYPWTFDTHDTSAVFSGEAGITYKFYSVATDSAGNTEAAPALYDAITRVSGTGISQFGTGNKMQMKLYPNPADNRLTIETYFPEKSNFHLTLLNLCGHPVMTPKLSTFVKGTRKILLDVSHLPAGIYFVHVQTRYGVQNRKIVIR